jgi:hypothetical protein
MWVQIWKKMGHDYDSQEWQMVKRSHNKRENQRIDERK